MAEHSQACFDVQTRRCVCGIENRSVRVRDAAPELEQLLKDAHDELSGLGPTCGKIRALVARIDGKASGG